jgi:RNA polymerase sigma-70 factor (ECF subfamily)
VRAVRDLDLAEDVVQDAFASALDTWRRDGIPDTPAAWLTTAAKRRAIDRLRRDATFARKMPLLIVPDGDGAAMDAPSPLQDDRLRLIFTCCHPALAPDARVALALRLICGIATEDIARLFLVPEATMAARITRAKKKIATAGIPYRVPESHEWPERLPTVLTTIYLLFTEGYASARGDALLRPELIDRARDLGELALLLMPDEPDVIGLLALMLLTDARRATRIDTGGRLVRLRDQDRTRWDDAAIGRGVALAERALRRGGPRGPSRFAIEAAIAAVHAEAATFEDTDWMQIVALHNVLLARFPSPVVRLNRCVALAEVSGPAPALAEVDALADTLGAYPYLHAVRGDLLERLDRLDEAIAAFTRARELTTNTVEQREMQHRLDLLGAIG